MPIRRRIKPGDYLVQDDITGTNVYASETTRDYLGRLTKIERADPIQPQLFARPFNDPQPVHIYSPESPVPVADLAWSPEVGNTNVPTATDNAAAHLYDLGVGAMAVGSTFVVR